MHPCSPSSRMGPLIQIGELAPYTSEVVDHLGSQIAAQIASTFDSHIETIIDRRLERNLEDGELPSQVATKESVNVEINRRLDAVLEDRLDAIIKKRLNDEILLKHIDAELKKRVDCQLKKRLADDRLKTHINAVVERKLTEKLIKQQLDEMIAQKVEAGLDAALDAALDRALNDDRVDAALARRFLDTGRPTTTSSEERTETGEGDLNTDGPLLYANPSPPSPLPPQLSPPQLPPPQLPPPQLPPPQLPPSQLPPPQLQLPPSLTTPPPPPLRFVPFEPETQSSNTYRLLLSLALTKAGIERDADKKRAFLASASPELRAFLAAALFPRTISSDDVGFGDVVTAYMRLVCSRSRSRPRLEVRSRSEVRTRSEEEEDEEEERARRAALAELRKSEQAGRPVAAWVDELRRLAWRCRFRTKGDADNELKRQIIHGSALNEYLQEDDPRSLQEVLQLLEDRPRDVRDGREVRLRGSGPRRATKYRSKWDRDNKSRYGSRR